MTETGLLHCFEVLGMFYLIAIILLETSSPQNLSNFSPPFSVIGISEHWNAFSSHIRVSSTFAPELRAPH
jgi:hypothetical protein